MNKITTFRGVSRKPATSKMEPFVTIVNGFNPLTIVIRNFILDVLGVLDQLSVFFSLANLNLILIKKVQLDNSFSVQSMIHPKPI